MYRIVKTSFWSDNKIRRLTREERSLLLYLFTNQHTHISGIYYLPLPLISHEFNATTEEIKDMLEGLVEKEIIEFDYDEQVVWVRNMLRHQVSNISPNVSKSTTSQLETLHDVPLIKNFLDYYHHFNIQYKGYRIKPQKVAKPKPKPEPKPDPKPEPSSEKPKVEMVEWPKNLKDDEEFVICWQRWVSYRNEIKRPLTNATVNEQLKKMSKLGKSTAMRMIEQSISNGWRGLFEVKDNGQNKDLMSEAVTEWVQKKESENVS